ncbi:hypothetical protein [Litchfieldia alkalitelluris]|nr:hypothetical protein [Litchfieldia alkalitelluris]
MDHSLSSNIELIEPLNEDQANKGFFQNRKPNPNNETKIKMRFKTLFE